MSEKTFKVRPGEELDIFIKRRKENPLVGASQAKRRGIIDIFSRDESLPRRLSNQSYILIYDLGQLAGDEYVDNPYTFSPDVVYDNSSSNLEIAGVITIADYRAFEQTFIDNLDTLEATYRHLKTNDTDPLGIAALGLNAEGFPFTLENLNSANPNWTDNGLKLTPEQLSTPGGIGFGSPVYNHTVFVSGEFAAPITLEPDPLADLVTFTPGPKDKYFLVPNMYFVYAQNSSQSGSIDYLQYLNYFYRAVPRSTIVDPTNEFYPFSCPGFRQWENGNSLAFYNSALKAAQIARGLPGARLFETHGSGTSYIWEDDTPAVDYDNPLYTSLYPVYPAGDYETSNFSAVGRLNSILLAIIKQNDTFYFVWNYPDWE